MQQVILLSMSYVNVCWIERNWGRNVKKILLNECSFKKTKLKPALTLHVC
jgi:hypothetical protein